MELVNEIVEARNSWEAWMSVRRNKGAAGIDKMSVDVLDVYMPLHMDEIKQSICRKQYKPSPVRRVFIPKPNGKQRPLGIPTVVDRVVQQATAQVLNRIYEPLFSEHSYGFRPNRSCHQAINQALDYLNAGYEWVVDFDIEKYFDTVNHDKLISILREQVNDSATLHLIRSFLKSGVMEGGFVSATTEGVPQGCCISPILSNIYLDKLDKELESRELRFVRYADDFDISKAQGKCNEDQGGQTHKECILGFYILEKHERLGIPTYRCSQEEVGNQGEASFSSQESNCSTNVLHLHKIKSSHKRMG